VQNSALTAHERNDARKPPGAPATYYSKSLG
jgi:hypothetical protein